MQIAFTLSNPELQKELLDFIDENGDLCFSPEAFAKEALESALADRRLDRLNAAIAEQRMAAQKELFD